MKIESEIRGIINKVIDGKYIGKLKVIQEDDVWTLLLYLDKEQVPMVLLKQGTEEEFKNFIAQEMKERKLQITHFLKLVQIHEDKDE